MGEFVPSCAAISFLLFIFFLSGEISTLVNAKMAQKSLMHTGPLPKWKIFKTTWCMAKASASPDSLQKSLNFACSMIDCNPIHEGGACFLPNTRDCHTSFAMNKYYQNNGAHTWNCDFSNTALIAVTDPSYINSYQSGRNDNCRFGGSIIGVATEDTWCVAKPGTPESVLKANIDFICEKLKDCSDIQTKGSCFFPNTLMNHASFVMNLYYKTLGNYICDFNNTGVTVLTNPSFGYCHYP